MLGIVLLVKLYYRVNFQRKFFSQTVIPGQTIKGKWERQIQPIRNIANKVDLNLVYRVLIVVFSPLPRAQCVLFANFIKKETLVQVISCKFCKISKSTFFTEHLRTTASTNVSVFTQLDGVEIMMLYRIFNSKNSIHLGYLEQVSIFFQQFTVYNWLC